MKLYVSPISKKVTDAVLEFNSASEKKIGLIPSRRQVEWDGGYSNNWTTAGLREYVSSSTVIKRDHAGPSQGKNEDDGYESLCYDCLHFNLIHIDPWKAYPKYEEGLEWTKDMINFCYAINPNVHYEIGTEESIRKFSPQGLDNLVWDLSQALSPASFAQIKYLVVQSGTALEGNKNIGTYDKARLSEMIEVCKYNGLLSKEHNGDYLPPALIKEKFELGLDSINIAPEFGQIETKVYLDKIKEEKPHLLETFYKICYVSKKWEKWVGEDFNPTTEKEKLINICGHYVLSDDSFLNDIKHHFTDIDFEIKKNILVKLHELS